MPEKSPRQPRKPFQNTGRRIVKKSSAGSMARGGTTRDQDSGAGRRRPEGDGRMSKKFLPKRGQEEQSEGYRRSRSLKSGTDSDHPAKKMARKKFTREEAGTGKKVLRRRIDDEPRPKRGERKVEGESVPKRRGRKMEEGSKPVKPLAPGKYPSRRGVRFKPNAEKDGIRLNKYIANAGICSRREADELIRAGVIKVNGVVVTELGTKVMPEDKVQYEDQTISNEKKRYLLLNKQKGYVTTTKDPHAKNTVMELIEGACRERIYPVGRLDRNTTGLLLFTNDGELAKKLMHPSSRIRKLYHVVLDQPVSKGDILKIADGIVLDDERIQIDGIAYVEDAKDRREVGLELHSGQNRVVRRIFESLGYKVTKLDRVAYAGLTKKGISRGKWRFLTEQEVIRLKMLR